MRILVADAARELEKRGLLKRSRDDQSHRVLERVRSELGGRMPLDLADLYQQRIEMIGEFFCISPEWNDFVGWRPLAVEMTSLIHASAAPIALDGFGNLFGLDLRDDDQTPAVYFFDAGRGYEKPEYAVGSSLGAFMLLLAESTRAFDEGWPERWELKIDPDIDRCPRARAVWNTG